MPSFPLTKAQVTAFLKEDLKKLDVAQDVTTNAIPALKNKVSNFHFISKNTDSFLLCGVEALEIILSVFAKKPFKVHTLKKDCETVKEGDVILKGTANAAEFLIAERISLNLIQQLSGVATKTAYYMKLLEGTKIKVLDTRKTIPLFRSFQKYAVKCGGGENHRFGLFDMILIKDNHIAAAGSIEKAIKSAILVNKNNLKIEVECESLEQVQSAIKFPIHRIMLDNMSVQNINIATKIIRTSAQKIEIEVSGGVNLKNISEFKNCDIDFISIGDLTHSISSVDISAKILDKF